MCCSICILTAQAAVQAAVQAPTPGMLLATNCTPKICPFQDEMKGAATDSTVSLQTCEVKPVTAPAPTPKAADTEATKAADTEATSTGHLYLRSVAGLQPEEAQRTRSTPPMQPTDTMPHTTLAQGVDCTATCAAVALSMHRDCETGSSTATYTKHTFCDIDTTQHAMCSSCPYS